MKFNPRILGFFCNWCAYAAADTAGALRIQYPPNLRILRVMCTGRVDPSFIIKCFLHDCEGVLVFGCHIGECQYKSGNYEAIKTVILVKRILKYINLNPERVTFKMASISEGNRLANIIDEITNKIIEIGPLYNCDKIEEERIRLKIFKAINFVTDKKIRYILAKQLISINQENIIQNDIINEEIFYHFDKIISTEFNRI